MYELRGFELEQVTGGQQAEFTVKAGASQKDGGFIMGEFTVKFGGGGGRGAPSAPAGPSVRSSDGGLQIDPSRRAPPPSSGKGDDDLTGFSAIAGR